MNVRRAVTHGLGDEQVDDPHDGGVVGQHLGGGGGVFARRLGHCEGVDQPAHVVDGAVGVVDGAVDVGRRRDHHLRRRLEGGRQPLPHLSGGIRHRNNHAAVTALDRDRAQLAGDALGQERNRVRVRCFAAKVDKGHLEAFAEGHDHVAFGNRAHVDKCVTDAFAFGFFRHRGVELFGGDQRPFKQQSADVVPGSGVSRRNVGASRLVVVGCPLGCLASAKSHGAPK